MKDPLQIYETLVRDHSKDLYRIAFMFCGEPDRAEDLVQECFMEAWKGISKLRHVDRARAWLIQILRIRWYRTLNQLVRRRENECSDDLADIAAEGSPEDEMSSHDWIRQALQQLEPANREVFLLTVMEGFRCREVAEMMEVPLGTVLSRLHRARVKLKAYLEEQEAEAARLSDKVRRLRRMP